MPTAGTIMTDNGTNKREIDAREPRDPHASEIVDYVALTDEQKRQRRARSLAIALTLGALCLLFYIVTIVKLGPGVLVRPL
ncbi:MAG: protein CoxF [Xanthobacteraceae bacterium]|jgi:Na+/glutamate symporter|nr:protein CoxF [Xanthobacteraceae bacterium]